MKLSLQKATLLKRYKRFLADILLQNGSETTIHVANTGAMTGCAEPGDTVWYSTSDNPKRKYPYSWELTHTQKGDFICVNTLTANKVVQEALEAGLIPELNGFSKLQPEVKYGQENSRIDFKLEYEKQPDCFVEVKSVTLLGGNAQGLFPDAVTKRGQKHLKELITVHKQGQQAVLLFLVMHTGIEKVTAAQHIDPVYSQLLTQANAAGVTVLVYNCDISEKSITINHSLSLS